LARALPLVRYYKGAGAPVMTIVRMNSMLSRQPVIPTSFPTSERSKNIAYIILPFRLPDLGPAAGFPDQAAETRSVDPLSLVKRRWFARLS
jgi:hypothetical protein